MLGQEPHCATILASPLCIDGMQPSISCARAAPCVSLSSIQTNLQLQLGCAWLGINWGQHACLLKRAMRLVCQACEWLSSLLPACLQRPCRRGVLAVMSCNIHVQPSCRQ